MSWFFTNIPHNDWSGEEAILVIEFLQSIIGEIEFRYAQEIQEALASRRSIFDPDDDPPDDVPFVPF